MDDGDEMVEVFGGLDPSLLGDEAEQAGSTSTTLQATTALKFSSNENTAADDDYSLTILQPHWFLSTDELTHTKAWTTSKAVRIREINTYRIDKSEGLEEEREREQRR